MAGPQYGGLLLHQAQASDQQKRNGWDAWREAASATSPATLQALSRLPEDEPFELWQQAYASEYGRRTISPRR